MKNIDRFVPFFVLVFLVGTIGFATYKIGKKQEVELQNIDKRFDGRFVKVNIELPEFSLPDLYDENATFSKKDLSGKYSLINLFASWCTTCRAEHQVLMRLKSEGIIDIYGVAWHDINQNTKDYLSKEGDPFTRVAADNQAIFTKFVGTQAIPETLLVNDEGVVVWRYKGNLEETAIAEIRGFLNK